MLAIALSLSGAAMAADDPPIAGDYVCKSGCRLTDAPPGIEISGTVARCMSELGGVFIGRLLTKTSVSCFNQVGTLSPDGKEILWSNGSVWKRR